MTTMRTLITGSLRLLNVIQANEEPTAQDMDISLASMNALVDSLGNDLLNIFTLSPLRFVLTPGQETYTLGPATVNGVATNADWVTERPMRIEQAKVILYPTLSGGTNPVTDPYVVGTTQSSIFTNLELISDEKYADIAIRDLRSTWPLVCYDSGSYPLRTLKVWPVPQNQYAVELWLWDPLATYSTLDDELNLPPGYERYLRYKLAVELSAEFGKSPSESVMCVLTEAETNIKRLNQATPVAQVSTNASRMSNRVSQSNLTRSW